MREKLNDNPRVQAGVVAVLLLFGVIFLLSQGGGGGSESESESESAAPTATTSEGTAEAPTGLSAALAMVSQASAGSARPVPRPVFDAWEADKTVVLLFVHDGGIDDRIVKETLRSLAALPESVTFVVPASKISRYAAITEGVGVNRVPALVVVRPKRLHQTVPTASVNYGFQSGESIVQAVIDAGYRGPTLSYHP